MTQTACVTMKGKWHDFSKYSNDIFMSCLCVVTFLGVLDIEFPRND